MGEGHHGATKCQGSARRVPRPAVADFRAEFDCEQASRKGSEDVIAPKILGPVVPGAVGIEREKCAPGLQDGLTEGAILPLLQAVQATDGDHDGGEPMSDGSSMGYLVDAFGAARTDGPTGRPKLTHQAFGPGDRAQRWRSRADNPEHWSARKLTTNVKPRSARPANRPGKRRGREVQQPTRIVRIVRVKKARRRREGGHHLYIVTKRTLVSWKDLQTCGCSKIDLVREFRYVRRCPMPPWLPSTTFRPSRFLARSVCVAVGLLGAGCRPTGHGGSPPAASVPAWASEPLMATVEAPTVVAPSVTAVPLDSVPPGGAMFDPRSIVPVLDAPEYAEVKALVEREAFQAAADKLDASLTPAAAAKPAAPSEPAALFQLAILRAASGMPGPAVQAYDRAAATPWPLAEHARLRAARILVELGQPAEALRRLDALGPVGTLVDEASLVRVRALVGLHRVDEATPIVRAYLAREPKPSDWQNEALRFATALLEQPSDAHAQEAAKFAELVIYQSPFGRGVGEARQLEERALASLPFVARQSFVAPGRAEQVARVRTLADSNQAREALAAAERLIAELSKEGTDSGDAVCEAHAARGKALSTLKRYSEATDAFGIAIDKCQGNALASAYYLGGRAALRGGRPALARQRYFELETRFHSHRLADDARLHGAEAARALGDMAAFTALLLRIAEDYPEGDMVDQGLFALALARLEVGDWAGAVWPLERSIERQKRGRPYWSEGRPAYFLGRARIELGQPEQGKALLVSVIRDYPLSYFMMLAEARLRALDPALAKRTLDEARAAEPEGAFVIADHPELHRPEFSRAVELVRQHEGPAALRELDALGVRERSAHPSVLWAAAFLLARIEAPAESHGLLRSAQVWSEHFPAGIWRPLWELAFPRPYAQLVPGVALRFGIPEHLAYAIMREESAFKANATSPAAAFGLMQLLVPTAKMVAGPLGLAYDERALKLPAINITLGSRFLSILTKRFAYNPLLAIPGYNAGPGAPDRWVEAHPNADFDVFVESIPYTETREYTKRVMKTMAAYATLYGAGFDAALVRPPLKVKPVTASLPPAPPPMSPLPAPLALPPAQSPLPPTPPSQSPPPVQSPSPAQSVPRPPAPALSTAPAAAVP